MSQTTTVALTITLEAAAYVQELGMQEQFEQMLEHARQLIPGIHVFDVSLLNRYDEGENFGVVIVAHSDDPSVKEPLADREWNRWQIETFPPNVWQYFTLFVAFSPNHAR